MRVLGIDTETTGLEQAKGHRIIEIAMVMVELDPARPEPPLYLPPAVEKFVQQINPERSIDPEAEAVHKIGIAQLVGKPNWNAVAPNIAAMMKKADIIVAHNMAFDGPFIAAELMRIGMMPPAVNTFCTMENARWATAHGKYPRLGELAWSLGVDYDTSKAHAAEYDILVTLRCLTEGLRRGFYTFP